MSVWNRRTSWFASAGIPSLIKRHGEKSDVSSMIVLIEKKEATRDSYKKKWILRRETTTKSGAISEHWPVQDNNKHNYEMNKFAFTLNNKHCSRRDLPRWEFDVYLHLNISIFFSTVSYQCNWTYQWRYFVVVVVVVIVEKYKRKETRKVWNRMDVYASICV